MDLFVLTLCGFHTLFGAISVGMVNGFICFDAVWLPRYVWCYFGRYGKWVYLFGAVWLPYYVWCYFGRYVWTHFGLHVFDAVCSKRPYRLLDYNLYDIYITYISRYSVRSVFPVRLTN